VDREIEREVEREKERERETERESDSERDTDRQRHKQREKVVRGEELKRRFSPSLNIEVGVRGDVGVIQSTNAPGCRRGSESLAISAATNLMSSSSPSSGSSIFRCTLASRSKF
jgi:hypothetical protein